VPVDPQAPKDSLDHDFDRGYFVKTLVRRNREEIPRPSGRLIPQEDRELHEPIVYVGFRPCRAGWFGRLRISLAFAVEGGSS
jgi:hypothetical protein